MSDPRTVDARFLPALEARQSREHHYFSSTMVAEAWYVRARQELEIKFVDGTRYLYRGVPFAQWSDFREAVSAGRYVLGTLNQHDYQPL